MPSLRERYPFLFEDLNSSETRHIPGGIPLNPNSEALALIRALDALGNSPLPLSEGENSSVKEHTYFHDDIVTILRTDITQVLGEQVEEEIILRLSYQIATLLLQALPDYESRKRLVQEFGKKLIPFLVNVMRDEDFTQIKTAAGNILEGKKFTNERQTILFLQCLGDNVLFEWLNKFHQDSEKAFSVFQSIDALTSLAQFSETNIYPFLEHPNRNVIIKKISVLDLVRILSATYVKGRPERVQGSVADCSFSLSFLLDNPRFLFVVNDTPFLDARTLADEPWGGKLLKLYRTLHSLDLDPGITDEDVLWAGERVWQPNPDNLKEVKKKERYPNLPEHSKRRALAQVKKGEGYDLNYEQKLRRFLKKERGLPLNRVLISEEMSNNLKLFETLEHPHHPVLSFLPLTGFEIESGLLPGMDRAVYGIMQKMGFQMGLDVVEFAPGPFRHPLIAETVFRSWVDGGLLDLHREVMPGAHFNVGTKSLYLAAKFTRLLHATSYAYIERFENKKVGYENPRVYRNKSIFGAYTEIKDFRVLTQEEFCRFLHEAAYIGASMKAYETIFRAKHKLSVSKFTEKTGDYGYKVELSDMDIKSSHLGSEQRKLALIWQRLTTKFSEGMRQVGLDQVTGFIAPMDKAERFYEAIDEVFPQVWDHYKPNRVNISFESTPRVEMFGQHFPNIVTFARYLTERATSEVEQVLNEAEGVMKIVLPRIASLPPGPEQDKQINRFINRFNCGYDYTDVANMLLETKKSIVNEVMKLYKIT